MKQPEAPALRILKAETCRSLSGASELTYHLGCDDQDNLYIRLWGNSAGQALVQPGPYPGTTDRH